MTGPRDDVPRRTGEDRTPPGRVLDLSSWPTADQIADDAHCAVKTVRREAYRGHLESARFKPPGGGQERTVYNPEDAAKFIADRQPAPLAPFLVPGPTPASNGNGHQALATGQPGARVGSVELAHAVARVLLAVVEKAGTAETPVSSLSTLQEDRWYGLDELRARKNLTRRGLWKRIRELGLKPRWDGGVRKLRGSEAQPL